MNNQLSVPQGQFQLQRLPFRANDTLRAWDAADEYILNYLSEQAILNPDSRILILNDSFGALACGLSGHQTTAISDSCLSHQATRNNFQANHLELSQLNLLDSLTRPVTQFDCVLIKVPKTLALLEYQLHQIKPCLHPGSVVIAAGMVKNLTANVWKLFEKFLGATQTSLAVKKARLIFVRPDFSQTLPPNPYPSFFDYPDFGWHIANHANVFSRESLDIGTRFLLQQLPETTGSDVIDLGCGNGIVGMAMAKRFPEAKISFVDESYMALASARLNYAQLGPEAVPAEFIAADCLTGFAQNSSDCIVCNPPFHQQHSIGDHIAWQMFKQAHQVLRTGGELRVIGNRHLNYHLSLKKLFGNCHELASNAKFVIFSCRKR